MFVNVLERIKEKFELKKNAELNLKCGRCAFKIYMTSYFKWLVLLEKNTCKEN